jgi:ABC-type histidine transport system ATPase subunit
MSLLAITGLEASYGDFRALHGVSFAVEAGEIISVVTASRSCWLSRTSSKRSSSRHAPTSSRKAEP